MELWNYIFISACVAQIETANRRDSGPGLLISICTEARAMLLLNRGDLLCTEPLERPTYIKSRYRQRRPQYVAFDSFGGSIGHTLFEARVALKVTLWH